MTSAKLNLSWLDWTDKLPGHWKVKKLKDVARTAFSSVDKHSKDGEVPVQLCNYVDVYYNERITSDLEFMKATATQDEIQRFALEVEDVIITKDSEEWSDIAVPAYVPANLPGVLCGYHLARVRPDPAVLDGRFLQRAFAARGVNDQLRVASTGITRYGLGKYSLDTALFPIPPLDEQRTIAAYLDRKTARIDALIGKKARQIELLQEKRTALISRAVTKGLDPNAKMKPSGVEWLGKIPEHWKVLPLKRITSIPITDGPHETPELFDDGIPFISAEAIKEGKIDFSNKRGFISHDDHLKFSRKYRPQRGDIYIVKSGATTGNVACVETDEEFNIWSPLAAVRANSGKVSARFALFFLKSSNFRQSIELSWSYGTQQNIGMNVIESLPMVIPPVPEQDSIAAFLDHKLTRIDSSSEKIKKSIDLLREYRSALISAAVTGKIDVREEVPA